MIVLDASIVITALPEIHSDLGFSPTGLSWVQNAYILTFGGLLLLGARAGDLLGRRRVFIAGLALFIGASFARWPGPVRRPGCSAPAPLQGVGAAIAAPVDARPADHDASPRAARAPARSRCTARSSAAGASIGVLLGGLLTDLLSWRWGLFINVPIGIAMVALAPLYLPDTEPRHGHFDLAGAATSVARHDARSSTASSAPRATAGATRARSPSFAVGAVLLAAFVAHRAARRAADHAAAPVRRPRARRRLRRAHAHRSAGCSRCSSS